MDVFICNLGLQRSRTAAGLFGGLYAGIYGENPPDEEFLSQADTIYVMEDHQREWIVTHFPKIALKKKLITLNIPDIYLYGDEELKEILKKKMKST